MKKFLSIIGCVVLCMCSVLVLDLAGCSNDNFNIANTMIANFENYETIGAGIINQTSVSANSSDPKKDNKHKKIKLVGKKKNGVYEEVTFKNDNDDDLEQTWQLSCMYQFGRFIFVSYTSSTNFEFNKSVNTDAFYIRNGDTTKTYIIDAKTGKIYPTIDIRRKVDRIHTNSTSVGYNDNVLYCSNGNSIYKFSIQNNDLVFEEIVNKDILSYSDYNIIVDRYNNLFLKGHNQNSFHQDGSTQYKYLITDKKELNLLSDNLYYSKLINNIVYTSDTTKKFDANGALIDSNDTVSHLYGGYNGRNQFLFEEEGFQYYFSYDSSNEYIEKVKWIDDVNFSIEKTSITNSLKSYTDFASANKKIYFLSDSEIFYLDIKTMTYGDIVSNYIFNSIDLNYDGNISFSALDKSMNIVNGTILPDGTTDITINNEYQVFYIAPLN